MKPFKHSIISFSIHRLPAFTFIELLLSMSLLVILLFLGQQIYGIFVKFQQNYVREVSATYDAALLQHQIDRDIQSAYMIQALSTQKICLTDIQGLARYCYELQDSVLIRTENIRKQSFPFQGQLQFPDSDQYFGLVDTMRSLTYLFWLPQRSRVK